MQSQLVTATKEFTWDMAHTLFQHKGLCQNLHGHTYRMLVTVSRSNTYVIPTGPSEGMVMDFKELKDLVKREIVDPLDHCTMIDSNNNSAFEVELLELLRRYNKKLVEVKYRPTAENMAIDFFTRLNRILEETKSNCRVIKIQLYETPTSYAEVSI